MFRLWLFVIGAFFLLIIAWTLLIFVAIQYAPEQVPVEVTHAR